VDADHLILFLDGSENEVFFWGVLPFAAPGNGITSERIAELFGIQFIEQRPEVEILTFCDELVAP